MRSVFRDVQIYVFPSFSFVAVGTTIARLYHNSLDAIFVMPAKSRFLPALFHFPVYKCVARFRQLLIWAAPKFQPL